MFGPIQSHGQPVTLVGAGDGSVELLKMALARAPTLLAVDGGAALAMEAGAEMAAVVGDFDSIGDLNLPKDLLLHTPDQNLTDFQKSLAATDAPGILAVGFLGGRLDHQLAAFTALLQDRRPIVLMSETELAFLAPAELSLDLPEGSAISFYPLTDARFDSSGVAYPLSDAAMAPAGLISTSNMVAGGPVRLRATGGVLVTLPLAGLDAVLAALWQ
ncbi:MAG: thiamine diphosphokinase [Pseudomonadota bacterium]